MELQGLQRGMLAGRGRFWAIAAIWMALVLSFNAVFLLADLHARRSAMAGELTKLAQSLQSLIHPEHIAGLEGGREDLESRRYHLVKGSLSRLAAANDDIQYAYVVAARGEEIIFLADSLAESDPTSVMPGDRYPQATDAYHASLATGESAFLLRFRDARGIWVRALVPVKDPNTGAPIALFGIDRDAAGWRSDILVRMLPDFLICACLILLAAALLMAYGYLLRLRDSNRKIAFSEALFHGIFDQAPIGIAISSRDCVVRSPGPGQPSANPAFASILARSPEELVRLAWKSMPLLDVSVREQMDRLFAGELSEFRTEKECLLPDGREIWINLMIGRLDGVFEEETYLSLIEDITKRKAAEAALRESERSKAVLLSHMPGMAYRCRYDRQWTMEFVSKGCLPITGYAPDELVGNRAIAYGNVIAGEYRDALWREWHRVIQGDLHLRYEYEIVHKSGERRWVLELGQAVRDAQGEVVALEGIIIDTTREKRRERQLAYLDKHDPLTGLFNRRHLLEAAARLDADGRMPISIAICDINGVRMVNFAFGNSEGDRLIADVGRIISACTRPGDLVGRTGGDEFTLILPGTDREEAGRLVRHIETAIERYNLSSRRFGEHLYEVNLSIGCDTKDSPEVHIDQAIKTAGDALMHSKLLNQKSSHSALLSSIMAALYARSHETEAHGQRLGAYMRMIGAALGYSPTEIDDLQLLAMLHDIGKIGIDDRVLNKPAALTPEEWVEMKKHSAIGQRIALASPEFEHIADYILSHHERWDGRGYPQQLAGEEIPLPSRILAVCDAYDAMTEDRVYRRAMSAEAASREIECNAGTQFDPEIARLFIRLISEQSKDA